MTANGSPRRRTPARRIVVGGARIVALLAIIIGVCGLLAPALTYRPEFYAVAVLFAVSSFLLLRGGRRATAEAAAPAAAAVAPEPIVIVDEAKIAAAREEERDRWSREVASSVDSVRRVKQELAIAEQARAALKDNLNELTQTVLGLRQEIAKKNEAANQQIARADALVAELNNELSAAKKAAEELRAQHARDIDQLKRATAQREAESAEQLRKSIEGAKGDQLREVVQRDGRINELQRLLDSERGVRQEVAALARELQQQLAAATAAQGDLSRSLDRERARIAELEQQLTARESDWNDKVKKIVDGMTADHESEIAEVTGQREDARAQLQSITARVHDLEQQLGARDKQFAEITQAMKAERGEVHGRHAVIEQQLAEREKTIAELRETHESTRKELARHVAERETSASRLRELEQQLAAREAEANEMLQRANDDHAQQLASRDADANETLQRAKNDHAQQLAALENEWNGKLQKIVAGMAADHENDIGTAIEQREGARAEARAMTARVQALEHDLAAKESEWSEKLQKIVAGMAADHENDIGTAIEQREGARAEARALNARVQALEHDLAAKESEWNEKLQKIVAGMASDHENDVGEVTVEREAARAEVRHLTVRVQELQQQLDQQRASVVDESALRAKVDSEWSEKLQTIVTHLASDHDEDIGKAVEQKEEAKAEVRTLTMKVNTLQRQLENDRQMFLVAEEKWNGVRDALKREIEDLRSRSMFAPPVPAAATIEPDPFPTSRLPTPEPFPSPFGSVAAADAQRARAEVLEFAEQAHAVLKRTAPGTSPIPLGSPRGLILFVHHDPTMRTMWRDQLHKHGYDVITAVDGLEGLRLATAQRPAVVIADVQMPKMDGRELCRMIKSNELTANAKVILMSGLSTVEMSKEGFHADEMLRKPVKFEALQSALNNLLGVMS